MEILDDRKQQHGELEPAPLATHDSKELKICKMMLLMLRYSFYTVDGSYAVMSILRPSSPEYLSSLVTHTTEPIKPAGVFFSFLFQAYVTVLSTEPSNVLLGLLAIFMFSTTEFL